MARKPIKRRPKKADVAAAADRAVKRSKGVEPTAPIDPVIATADEIREKMRGRPSTYKPEFAQIARDACMKGATDPELGEIFGVDRRTIYRWKIEHEEFCHALIVGKEIADDRVERALYEKAVGYELEVQKLFHHQGEITRATVIEYVQPDKGAIEMWLASRRAAKWRKVDRHEVSGPDGGPIEVAAIDKIKLARWIANELTTARKLQQPPEDSVH